MRRSRIRRTFGTRFRAAVTGGRGSAPLGLVLAAAAVAGGMTLGSGIASHHASSDYGLAWLTDSARGQLVQIDPVLGRTNVRLQVADPKSRLIIQQGKGNLIVIDRRTGKVTSIDLGTLLVSGTRTTRPGDSVKVVLAGSRLYIGDLARGSIQAVDPATQADIGKPWSAGRRLVDIGADGANDVWALDDAEQLHDLRWSAQKSSLDSVSTHSVPGAGPGSVIVGHKRGVTLIGSKGTVARVGTAHDTTLDKVRLRGPLEGPQTSPDDIVPVADPKSSSVVIVGRSNATVSDVASYGCSRPGVPMVFDGKVYVPCLGARKVLVLDTAGRQVGASIPTPSGGDPQLTVSGDRLVIDVPGSGKAITIDPSGDRHEFPTVTRGIDVQDPTKPPVNPPDPPQPKPRHPHHGNQGDRPNQGGGDDGDVPTPGGSGSGSSAPSGSNAPDDGGATAEARADGTVLVSWDDKSRGTTVVTATTTGNEVATVPAGATSATVTVLNPGTTTAFRVRGGGVDATTNTVTTGTAPGAVGSVSATGTAGSPGRLDVTWGAAPGNGAKVSYTITTDLTKGSVTTSALHASVKLDCKGGCSGTVTVTAANSLGNGGTGTFAFTVAGGAPAPPPVDPTTPAPPPPADPTTTAAPPPQQMPAAGQNLITYTKTMGSDAAGTFPSVTITVNAPGDWQSFTGTCSLTDNGADIASVPCAANNWSQTFSYDVSGDHEYKVLAHGDSSTVESAPVTVTVVYRQICSNSASQQRLTGGAGPIQRPIDCNPAPCDGCQIPYLDPQKVSGAPARAAVLPRGIRAAVRGMW